VLYNSAYSQTLLALAWGFFLTFSAVWFIRRILRNKREQDLVSRSLSWPEVSGVILESKALRGYAEIRYEYVVGSQRLTGVYETNLGAANPGSFSGESAPAVMDRNNKELARFGAGQPIVIRYNPQNPSESVFFCLAGETIRAQRQAESINQGA
jgi:hypothetical protein